MLIPPVKVARTQRQGVASTRSAANDSFNRTNIPVHDSAGGRNDSRTMNGHAVIPSQAESDVHMRWCTFLSGVGRHLCWLVDENTNLLRIWNLSASHTWRRTQPRIEYIPYWSHLPNEAPLFACEIDDVTKDNTSNYWADNSNNNNSNGDCNSTALSIAFCSAHGIVTSLDNSAQFRVVSEDHDPVVVSSFACARRYRAPGCLSPCRHHSASAVAAEDTDAVPAPGCCTELVTALGTEDGMIIVDVHGHRHSSSSTTDKDDDAAYDAPLSRPHVTAKLDGATLTRIAAVSIANSANAAPLTGGDSRSSQSQTSWWSALKSLVHRARRDSTGKSPDEGAAKDEEHVPGCTQRGRGEDGGPCQTPPSLLSSSFTTSSLPGRRCRGAGAPVTHVLLRRSETDQVVAATSAAMIYLLSFDRDLDDDDGHDGESEVVTGAGKGTGSSRCDSHKARSDGFLHGEAADRLSLRPLWCCSVRQALHIPESASPCTTVRVLALAETRHTICALVLVFVSSPPAAASSALPGITSTPSLVLLTIDSPTGVVVNYIYINAIVDVVAVARDTAPQHIGLYLMDHQRCDHNADTNGRGRGRGRGRRDGGRASNNSTSSSHSRAESREEQSADEVIILIKNFCLRVNNQVDVRQPCASEDLVVMRGLSGPIASVWRGAHVWGEGEDGAGVIIALDKRGPHRMLTDDDAIPDKKPDSDATCQMGFVTVEEAAQQHRHEAMYASDAQVDASCASLLQTSHVPDVLVGTIAPPFVGEDVGTDCEDGIGASARVAELLRTVRADAGHTSLDALVLQMSAELSREQRVQRGNWARADLNTEDNNTVLYVTRQLRRRQQRHRRFVRAVYGSREAMSTLLPGTLAQLISTQEALLALVSLRGLQNASFAAAAWPTAAAAAAAGAVSCTQGHDAEGVGEAGRGGRHGRGAVGSAAMYRTVMTRAPRIPATAVDEMDERLVAPSSRACGADGGHAETAQVHDERGGKRDATAAAAAAFGQETAMRLIQDESQLRVCQQILRETMVRVASGLRISATATDSNRRTWAEGAAAGGAIATTTAVELVYSSPAHLLLLLEALTQYVRAACANAAQSVHDKFATAYAVGCLFVIVAQTVTESRDDLAMTCRMSSSVRSRLWTSSEEDYDTARGVAATLDNISINNSNKNNKHHNTNTSDFCDLLSERCTRLSGLVLQMCEELSQMLADSTAMLDFWSRPPADVKHAQSYSRHTSHTSDTNGIMDTDLTRDAEDGIGRGVGLREQNDLLDLLVYLVQFSLLHHNDVRDANFFSAALRHTLLRTPFVREPYGYPHGPPTAVNSPSQPNPSPHTRAASASASSTALVSPTVGLLNERIVQLAESLALSFHAVPVLMSFALSTVTPDPLHPCATAARGYARLRGYCAHNPRLYSAALRHLWHTGREWELLCLHAIVGERAVSSAQQERDAFLESHAPHLLWLATPSRFDALVREGAATLPALRYGGSALQHRTRCLALARLAWIADGAGYSGRSGVLELDEAVVAAQRVFLSNRGSHGKDCNATANNSNPSIYCNGNIDDNSTDADAESVVLGPQALVQRLLRLSGCVEAWVTAARVVCLTAEPLRGDLLVQILQHCRSFDGPSCLQTIERECACELDTSRAIAATALGQVILACESMQELGELSRLCESILTADEFRLISSWLVACWSGEDGNNGGPDGVRRLCSVA